MRGAGLLVLAALCGLAPACGEDDTPARPATGQATPAPAVAPASGAGGGSGKQLVPQTSIEDRVICRVESNAKKKCDPKTPKCEQGEHCITSTDGSFCGPCRERDTIRRPFRPRDFVATFDTRDPFQSFIISQPGLDAGSGSGSGGDEKATDPARSCTREDQMVAQSYSYQDLKLVGIVTQGTQRKVLMLDSTNLGHIIKRGDCVGREKAVVKEIGKEYITFELHQEVPGPDPGPGGRREAEQRSVQLYPKQIPASSLPSEQPASAPANGPGLAPVVAPPGAPRPPAEGGSTAARQPTRIRIVPPPAQGPAVPSQAPTTLAP